MSKRFTARALQRRIGTEIPADRLCRIWSGEHGAWWRPESAGYTHHVEAAGAYPVAAALAIANGVGPEKRLSFDVAWDYPIIFSAAMIHALLSGRKIMTRRYAWSETDPDKTVPRRAVHRYIGGKDRMVVPTIWQEVAPGDRLWVRENFRVGSRHDATKPRDLTPRTMTVAFAAGGSMANDENGWNHDPTYPARIEDATYLGKLRPAIYLPRWASRLVLDVTASKTERLQRISEVDARAEGAMFHIAPVGGVSGIRHDPNDERVFPTAMESFQHLWSQLHGEPSWKENPEVVAMSFSVHQRNIDVVREAA